MDSKSIYIKQFEDKYITEIIDIWNTICPKEALYKPLKVNDFNDKFINNSNFDYKGTFVLIENDEVCGFASGVYKKEYLPGENFSSVPGYITMVMVKKDKRRMGYGKLLVEKVEGYLKQRGKNSVRIDFLNPINLQWLVPGTIAHDHPNAPGVDVEGDGYQFFKNIGYIERAVEVSMYNDLSKFYLNEAINEKYKGLCDLGISIQMYDTTKHKGLDTFFDNIKNEQWRKDINGNLSLESPFPLLIAVNGDKICGFAGPLEIEDSGRGKFCGIGVDPNFEGKGIGTLLFFMLCDNFKEIGATFMSLFTGENGNARKIYSSAGFKVVRRWALLKKDI